MGFIALLVLALVAFMVVGVLLHLVKFALVLAIIVLGVAFVSSKLPSGRSRNP